MAFQPVIDDSVAAYQATYLSHPQPVIDQVGTNLYSLVNRELLGVSSLSKAISQKPSRRASNPQPSDPESETLTARPWTHPNTGGHSAKNRRNFPSHKHKCKTVRT